MKVSIKYFARYREALSCGEEELELKKESQLKDLIVFLSHRRGEWGNIFSNTSELLFAVNQEIAKPEYVIRDGDEIAFYPPVTGG